MNLKTVMALAISVALAAPVLAQQARDSKDSNPAAPRAAEGSAAGTTAGGFAAMDRNNDGYISRDEARDATWNTRFSELDKDNDGRLSQSEFDALQGEAAGAAGATGDKDKPGQKQ
jgi:EF hand domain-containing protein